MTLEHNGGKDGGILPALTQPFEKAARLLRGQPDFREVGGRKEQEISQRIVATYFAHDSWRKKHRRGKRYQEPIIDVALVTAPSLRTELSPQETIIKLQTDLAILQGADLNQRPDLVCLCDSLEATVTYLQEEQKRKRDKKTPYAQYLKRTIHLTPSSIPDETLKQERSELLNLLKSLGHDFGDLLDPRKQGLVRAYEEFEEQHKITDYGQLRNELADSDQKVRKIMKSKFGEDPIPSYTSKRVNVKSWWKAQAVARFGFHLDINYHEKVAGEWVKGVPFMYGLHELAGHFGAYNALKKLIEEGKVNYALGISTLVDPRAFSGEGLAQTLHLFFDLKLPIEVQIALAKEDLKSLAITEGLNILGSGKTLREAALKVSAYYPFYDYKRAREELSVAYNNALDRAYLPIYGHSLLAFREIAEQLTPEQRIKFVKAVYPSSMTPEQVWATFKAIKEEDLNESSEKLQP